MISSIKAAKLLIPQELGISKILNLFCHTVKSVWEAFVVLMSYLHSYVESVFENCKDAFGNIINSRIEKDFIITENNREQYSDMEIDVLAVMEKSDEKSNDKVFEKAFDKRFKGHFFYINVPNEMKIALQKGKNKKYVEKKNRIMQKNKKNSSTRKLNTGFQESGCFDKNEIPVCLGGFQVGLPGFCWR